MKSWIATIVEKELEDYDNVSMDDRAISVAVVILFPLIGFFFRAHSELSTGFFTVSFGGFEKVLLYGTLMYWIFTCVVLLLEFKDLSRDVDTFGGLIFAVITFAWLFMVFPFDFTHFADALPDGLKFLVQWISNSSGRVLLGLGFIIHLIFAIVAMISRVPVRKELAKRRKVKS